MQEVRPDLASEAQASKEAIVATALKSRPTNVGRKVHPTGLVESTVVKGTDRYSQVMAMKTNNGWQKYDRKKMILEPARIKNLEKTDQDFSAKVFNTNKGWQINDGKMTILGLVESTAVKGTVWNSRQMAIETNKGWKIYDDEKTILELG